LYGPGRARIRVPLTSRSLASIEKEQKFKTAEYQSIYRLSTQFEVLGAAAVYVPIFFQFQCKIKSVYGDIDYTLDYNIFDKEVIPPTCTCGNAIYQGHVCSNLHFSCTTCTGICADCKVEQLEEKLAKHRLDCQQPRDNQDPREREPHPVAVPHYNSKIQF
jgi:hypothetical protein